MLPSATIPSSSLSRLMLVLIVLKFVSIPPSQRSVIQYWLQRSASSWITAFAWRLVPTKSTWPPPATVSTMVLRAFSMARIDFCRSMM